MYGKFMEVHTKAKRVKREKRAKEKKGGL